MNAALWICQGFLAAICIGSGSAKLVMSKERLIETGQTAAKIVPMPALRFVAGTEWLAALGLTLPWLTDVAPALTPLAACGFGVVMVGAFGVHSRLREPLAAANSLFLLALCVVVAAGRF